MSKIRINELARQLEVPSHEVLELLSELGVVEKKTHSSSLDDTVAELVRHHYQGGAGRPVSSYNGARAELTSPVAGERRIKAISASPLMRMTSVRSRQTVLASQIGRAHV